MVAIHVIMLTERWAYLTILAVKMLDFEIQKGLPISIVIYMYLLVVFLC